MYPGPRQTSASELQSLLAYIEREYCGPIGQVCNKILEIVTEIHDGDPGQEASLFTSTCARLVQQSHAYLKLRRSSLKAHMDALVRSEEEGLEHRHCYGTCFTPRDAQLAEISDVHKQLNATLDILRAVREPGPGKTPHQKLEIKLRKEVKRLDEFLSELMYLEQNALVPRFEEVQKHMDSRPD